MKKIIFKTDNNVINNWLPKFAVCKNGDALESVKRSLERVFPCKTIVIGGNKSFAVDQNDKPIYEELPGWSEDISKAKNINELPKNAREYVEYLEKISGAPISAIGVGPARDETIVITDLVTA